MTTPLAGTKASPEQIAEWVEQFHRDGYLFIRNVLHPDHCAELRADLDRVLEENRTGEAANNASLHLHPRMFEQSDANLRLFDMEPIVSFAEALVSPNCHVIHNNSFRTYTGCGITTWHQDDAPHFLVTEGEPPTNIKLPVLWFTANYYLTEVDTPDHGGTEVIPGSHRFGASPPGSLDGTKWESQVAYNCGRAGSVIMFNNQVWHRGGPNRTERTRYMTQITYARRMIGHKYFPFMNYQMPEHIYRDADPRLKRLVGFLPSGAYG
ncbi:MAG: phytanoyl-CoA dioxygenase family protein [Candidatus Poribacteria bacterium]|nr:phytanoyl-CoA dioxygenase family protein [Candidatus Poribacteria bacterium]